MAFLFTSRSFALFSSLTVFLSTASAQIIINSYSGSAPTAGGTTITLNGGPFQAPLDVILSGSVISADSIEPNTIQFTLPPGTGTDLPLFILAGKESSNTVLFSYDPPVVNSMTPDRALTSSNEQITFNGKNFGANPADVSVVIGGSPASILSASHTQLLVQKPVTSGTDNDLQISVGGQAALFSFARWVNLTSPPGYYVDTTTNTVKPAPLGRFAPSADLTATLSAPVGTYAPIEGMSQAIQASPGYFVPNDGQAEQTPAPAGRFTSTAGMSVATFARPGHYVPVSGMSTELETPVGHFTAGAGSTEPIPADPGRYVPMKGQTSALNAPAGKYVPFAGMSDAIPAPDGSYVPDAGATSVQKVPAGFTSDGTSITALPQLSIIAYTLEENGDNTLTFETALDQNYGIFYTENLADYTLLEFVSGTGAAVTRTFTPPVSATGKRFYVVGPAELP